MAKDSVGQIGLDLVVNKGDFEKQMSSIQGLAKKAGATLAAAFAVKKIVDFGAQCIELGSDLAEVQNVVDVTFPHMNRQIDEFAKNAISSFGLSETMAKKFTGTFGAMAKAFGFGEQQAYEMSTTLTGLAGDVASFYNISQDEAYTKLKSVFSGETETLKDLGIVMTQSALDAYALANGYGKTTNAMSEMEKVALRYAFVQDQLTLASGDFLRTSDGWANQIRVLKLRFDSLKATIGQGLINVLTPVIKVINTIIGKLMSLANAFKAFTELISGKSSGGGVASGMDAVASASEKAEAAATGAGSAAKKAAKDIKGATTGIDELNIIQAPDSGGAGSSGGAGGYAADTFDMGEIDTSAIDEVDSRCQELIDKVQELKGLLVKGFWDGFRDQDAVDGIKQSIESIKNSISDIFDDKKVRAAANRWSKTISESLGKSAGAMASIGVTIANNLLGGVSFYLEDNSGRIKNWIARMFDLSAEKASIAANFLEAVAEIFSVFSSDTALQVTADIIKIFSDGFMGAAQLASSFGLDVLNLITTPIIANTSGFKEALGGLITVVQSAISTIANTLQQFIDEVLGFYDQSIAPLMQSLRNGVSEIVEVFLEAFNTHILPVLQNASGRFHEFCEGAVQPLIEKFLEFAAKVTECVRLLWENVIRPFIKWFVENVAPVIANNLQVAINAFFSFLDGVSDIISGVLDVLNALLDFLLGVFTGDWSRAWNGVKNIFRGIWETMSALLETIFNAIYSFILIRLTAIQNAWDFVWNGIHQFFEWIWNSIQATVNSFTGSMQDTISKTLTAIQSTWGLVWNAILTTINVIWNSIQSSISDKVAAISQAIAGFVDVMKQVFNGLLEFITGVFTGDWSKAWEGVKNIFKGIFNSIVSLLESAMNFIVSGINRVLDGINDVVGAVGDVIGLDFEIPTMKKVSLPRLAQGGFVRANTPQLAMIGDNRRYGEIVAPEDKMQEMVDRAVAMASQGSGMSDQYLIMMIELLKQIIDLIEAMDLTVNIDIREIKKKLTELDKRSGYTLRST